MHSIAAVVLVCLSLDGGVDLKESLRDPARVFPAFQQLVREGLYGRAYDCLSGGARRAMSYEEFYLAFTSVGALRRLVAAGEVHAVDADAPAFLLCSAEFGTRRQVRLAKLGPAFLIDFTVDDLEYFKERALAWHRCQVRRADGWHFAYPPDWDYAPLARTCGCGQ